MKYLFPLLLLCIFSCKGRAPTTAQMDEYSGEARPLKTGIYFVSKAPTSYYRKDLSVKGHYGYYIVPKPIVTAKNISQLEVRYEEPDTVLAITLDKQGTANFAAASGGTWTKELALVIENKLVIVARVADHVTDGHLSIRGPSPGILRKMKRNIEKGMNAPPPSHDDSLTELLRPIF